MIAFTIGIIGVINLTVRGLKRNLTYHLKYIHAFLACLSVSITMIIIYRIYCLLMYTDAEISFLLTNYRSLLKGFLMCIVISAISAASYKMKKNKTENMPKDIQDMFDIDMNKQVDSYNVP